MTLKRHLRVQSILNIAKKIEHFMVKDLKVEKNIPLSHSPSGGSNKQFGAQLHLLPYLYDPWKLIFHKKQEKLF